MDDVFISYSGKDAEVVFEKVVTPLRNRGMRVGIDRDFAAGNYITSAIRDAIKNSRKILFIVTDNFLQSGKGWIEFEDNLSQFFDFEKRKRSVIPVLLVDESKLKETAHEGLSIYTKIKVQGFSDSSLIPQIEKNVWDESRLSFEFATGGSVLAIGSHWDDILLGCLGTLIKLKETLGYEIHLTALCQDYGNFYYGARQNITKQAKKIYKDLGDNCGFSLIEYDPDDEHLPPETKTLIDREFRQNLPNINYQIKEAIRKNNEKNSRPYNLIFCPPIDDKNSDHAATAEIVFNSFRNPNHIILEYPIKRYTERNFKPNICIGLDENIGMKETWKTVLNKQKKEVAWQKILMEIIRSGCNWNSVIDLVQEEKNWEEITGKMNKECPWPQKKGIDKFDGTDTFNVRWKKILDTIKNDSKILSIADAKVYCIEEICGITNENDPNHYIINAERLFSSNAIRSRMHMNAIDYGRRFDLDHAEVFRGRIDL
jgi:hypothetical protein